MSAKIIIIIIIKVFYDQPTHLEEVGLNKLSNTVALFLVSPPQYYAADNTRDTIQILGWGDK